MHKLCSFCFIVRARFSQVWLLHVLSFPWLYGGSVAQDFDADHALSCLDPARAPLWDSTRIPLPLENRAPDRVLAPEKAQLTYYGCVRPVSLASVARRGKGGGIEGKLQKVLLPLPRIVHLDALVEVGGDWGLGEEGS